MFTSLENLERKFQLKKIKNETKNGKVVVVGIAIIVAILSITYYLPHVVL
jgi:hypothetical protein